MLYCDPCANRRNWPVTILSSSYGPCETCGWVDFCNDFPSRMLPEPDAIDEPDQSTSKPGR